MQRLTPTSPAAERESRPGPQAEPAPSAHGAPPPWVHALVRVMDDAIPLPGTQYRIGLDAILGLLLPAVGDAITAASHLTLLYYAFRSGVPAITIARMVLNVAVDELWGSIPIVGDWFDVGFRANRKNLQLIAQRGGARRGSRWTDYLVVSGAFGAVLAIVLLPLLLLGLLGGAVLHWLR